MPEGHTIHRMARDQTKWFAGQPLVVSSPQGRFEKEARRLSGKQLINVEAHGKHLFYRWSNGILKRPQTIVMHVHLGLYGKFRIHKNPPPPPRGAVRVRMIGDQRSMDLNGPTKCEILRKAEVERLEARLGADPLRSDADPEKVFERIAKSKKAIGAMLLDQSLIAGIGNIYRAEILFLLGIAPERPGNQIERDQFERIWQLSVDLMTIGVRHDRIITVPNDEISKPLSKLRRDERVLIYKKERCSQCGSPVRKFTLGARTMYACDTCQK